MILVSSYRRAPSTTFRKMSPRLFSSQLLGRRTWNTISDHIFWLGVCVSFDSRSETGVTSIERLYIVQGTQNTSKVGAAAYGSLANALEPDGNGVPALQFGNVFLTKRWVSHRFVAFTSGKCFAPDFRRITGFQVHIHVEAPKCTPRGHPNWSHGERVPKPDPAHSIGCI